MIIFGEQVPTCAPCLNVLEILLSFVHTNYASASDMAAVVGHVACVEYF